MDGPIDRTRYSPVAWLPGGEAFYYVRRIAPELCPPARSSSTGGCGCTGSGTDPATDVEVLRRGPGQDQLLRRHRLDGRPVARRRRRRRARHLATTCGWPTSLPTRSSRRRCGSCRRASTRSTSLHVGRDGRAYLFTDRDAPRGRLAVTSPDDPAYEAWTDLVPEDAEAVLEGFAILDGPDELAGRRRTLLCLWTRHAMSEITVHVLSTGERTGTVPLPGLGSVTGLAERPEGGHEAWFGYTDHVVPSSVTATTRRTGETRSGPRRPARSRCRRCTRRQVEYVSADGTTVRMLVLPAPRSPTGRGRRCSTATAASASR